MTIQQVMEVERQDKLSSLLSVDRYKDSEELKSLVYFDSELQVDVIYVFRQNALEMGYYDFKVASMTREQIMDRFEQMREILNEKYQPLTPPEQQMSDTLDFEHEVSTPNEFKLTPRTVGERYIDIKQLGWRSGTNAIKLRLMHVEADHGYSTQLSTEMFVIYGNQSVFTKVENIVTRDPREKF